MNETINICLTLDSRYMTGAQVTCFSILSNLKEGISPDFHVICNEMNNAFEEALRYVLDKSCRSYDLTLYVIDDSRFEKFPDFFFESKMTYARLLIPEIIEVDELIYIDSDFLVTKDVSELSGAFPDGVWCKACVDTTTKTLENEVNQNYGGVINPNIKSLNAGLLVLSLAKLRENEKFQEAMSILIERGDTLRNWDQSAINLVLNGKFEQICPSWNYMVNHYPKNFKLFADHGVNFHFVTSHKPWLVSRAVMPFILFYQYWRMSGSSQKFEGRLVSLMWSHLLYRYRVLARLYYGAKVLIGRLSKRQAVVDHNLYSLNLTRETSSMRKVEQSFFKRYLCK